jgi:hypothetical protein
MMGLQMVDGTVFVKTQHGPVILIMWQYAYYRRQRTIHSSGQIEAYKNHINDHSMKVSGGQQCIRTNDGYVIPIDIINGLLYIKMQPNTTKEYKELPHVIPTRGTPWNPTSLIMSYWTRKIGTTTSRIFTMDLSRPHSMNTGITAIKSLWRSLWMREMMTKNNKSYTGSHSSKDTALRSDSILSEE